MHASLLHAVLPVLALGMSDHAPKAFQHFAPAPFDADDHGVLLHPWLKADGLFPLATPLAVDAAELKQNLREFSGAVEVQIGGKRHRLRERTSDAGLALARAWLRQKYEALGFTVLEHGGWGGTNFIAEKAGSVDDVVILSSHMDAVEDAPGADDDGAGTVTALAVAKALAHGNFHNTLRIVAFDQEELGLVGSSEYARDLRRRGLDKQVIANIQLEMTGYNPHKHNRFHVIDCNKKTSRHLTALVTDAVKAHGLNLTNVPACTDASDHASFWAIGRPAVVISENFFGGDGNPCYHEACDTVTHLDFDYMARTAQAAGAGVAVLLQPAS